MQTLILPTSMYRGGYLDHGGLPERPGLAVQTSRHVLSEQAVQSLYLGGGDGDQSCFALLCFVHSSHKSRDAKGACYRE